MADAAAAADADEAPAADGGGRLLPFAMTDIGVWFPARPQTVVVSWSIGRACLGLASPVEDTKRTTKMLLLVPRYGWVSWNGVSIERQQGDGTGWNGYRLRLSSLPPLAQSTHSRRRKAGHL